MPRESAALQPVCAGNRDRGRFGACRAWRWAARRECIPRVTPGRDASDADRIRKLLGEMRGKKGEERRARFVCVLVWPNQARRGIVFGIRRRRTPGRAAGTGRIRLRSDFLLPCLGKTYAEISREEKNLHSHRGKAFRKALEFPLSCALRARLGLTRPGLDILTPPDCAIRVLYSCAGMK
jgi:hypothetical protein